MSDPRIQESKLQQGLTLVELLVVLAIIFLILIIMIPFVTGSREAARLSLCTNNLKQIGLALHNYAGVWNGFPPASSPVQLPPTSGYVSTRFNPSPQVVLLPYLDLPQPFNALNFGQPMEDLLDLDKANSTVARLKFGSFLCPSDETAQKAAPLMGNSYRANLGPCAVCPESGQGALVPNVITPFDSFTDGTSTTIAFAEKLVGSVDRYDPQRDWIDTHATAPLSADAWVTLCSSKLDPRRANFNLGRTWLIAGGMQTHFFTAMTPNSSTPDCGSSTLELGYGAFTARSQHPGGVYILLADGSVRWLKSTITPAVWRALGTRAGAEKTRESDY